ncbi:kinase-like protein [Phanerochaete sordida]|uniref:Kinase-like protein n=1 Tax=Phanerochaete sordida TaxID=48140 RepID=A0A9P3G4R2_9APHY|nr:kinase-like protein [Phanerochaete sordida]
MPSSDHLNASYLAAASEPELPEDHSEVPIASNESIQRSRTQASTRTQPETLTVTTDADRHQHDMVDEPSQIQYATVHAPDCSNLPVTPSKTVLQSVHANLPTPESLYPRLRPQYPSFPVSHVESPRSLLTHNLPEAEDRTVDVLLVNQAATSSSIHNSTPPPLPLSTLITGRLCLHDLCNPVMEPPASPSPAPRSTDDTSSSTADEEEEESDESSPGLATPASAQSLAPLRTSSRGFIKALDVLHAHIEQLVEAQRPQEHQNSHVAQCPCAPQDPPYPQSPGSPRSPHVPEVTAGLPSLRPAQWSPVETHQDSDDESDVYTDEDASEDMDIVTNDDSDSMFSDMSVPSPAHAAPPGLAPARPSIPEHPPGLPIPPARRGGIQAAPDAFHADHTQANVNAAIGPNLYNAALAYDPTPFNMERERANEFMSLLAELFVIERFVPSSEDRDAVLTRAAALGFKAAVKLLVVGLCTYDRDPELKSKVNDMKAKHNVQDAPQHASGQGGLDLQHAQPAGNVHDYQYEPYQHGLPALDIQDGFPVPAAQLDYGTLGLNLHGAPPGIAQQQNIPFAYEEQAAPSAEIPYLLLSNHLGYAPPANAQYDLPPLHAPNGNGAHAVLPDFQFAFGGIAPQPQGQAPTGNDVHDTLPDFQFGGIAPLRQGQAASPYVFGAEHAIWGPPPGLPEPRYRQDINAHHPVVPAATQQQQVNRFDAIAPEVLNVRLASPALYPAGAMVGQDQLVQPPYPTPCAPPQPALQFAPLVRGTKPLTLDEIQYGTELRSNGETYMIHNSIGHGAQGSVFRALTSMHEPVAIKILRLAGVTEFLQGVAIDEHRVMVTMTDSGARFTVPLLHSWADSQFLYLVMPDYHETLQQKLPEKQTFEQKRQLMAEIICGLCEMHLQGYAHLDIKPDNILISPLGRAMLADFGLAHRLASTDHCVGRGTAGYTPPELIGDRGMFGSGVPDAGGCDVYSAGVTLLQIVLGMSEPIAMVRAKRGLPKTVVLPEATLMALCDGETLCTDLSRTEEMHAVKKHSEELYDLLTRMLQRNPAARCTLVDVMQHPFFAGIDWHNFGRAIPVPPQHPKPVLITRPPTCKVVLPSAPPALPCRYDFRYRCARRELHYVMHYGMLRPVARAPWQERMAATGPDGERDVVHGHVTVRYEA